MASSSLSMTPFRAHGLLCFEELPGIWIEDVALGDVLVHPVFDDLSGGVVAEHVVHGGCEFKSALVAVAFHGINPLGVNDAASEHAPGLVLEVAVAGPGGVGTVAEELARVAACQGAHGGNHAAVVLHVVVAVEDVVLAGVLVLGGNDDLAEPLAELGPGAYAMLRLGVGIATPNGIDLCEVLHRFPVPCSSSTVRMPAP